MNKYSKIIFWSKEDNCFIAEAPELPGCMAHGTTDDEALKNLRVKIALWIETANEFGDPIPTPKERRLVFA